MDDQDTLNQHYIQDKVHPILEKLLMDLLMDKPDDPVDFMRKWLANYETHQPQEASELESKVTRQIANSESEHSQLSEEEEDEEYELRDLRAIAHKKKAPRQSVSAEVYGAFNKKSK